MELSRYLRHYAKSVKDKTQLIISAFAKALETIPRQLCSNAGFDATDIIASLRAAHAKGERWMGVDIENEGIVDTLKVSRPSSCLACPSFLTLLLVVLQTFVWEPALVRQNALAAATEAACIVLSVDETVRNPKSEGLPDQGRPNM